MFEKEIKTYEALRQEYEKKISFTMSPADVAERNEILFSAHSCAIEGNSFTVGDTKELKDKGLGLIPSGKTLLEAFEILDHFRAFEYLMQHIDEPLSETLVKQTHRLLTANTLTYRYPDATPGEYTNVDMCAGETVFGAHETLVARLPELLRSTQQAIDAAVVHPVVLAARFHGFFEYLHPFRDGNGRLGRLLSNLILQKMQRPMILIPLAHRTQYLSALNAIRTENTDEHLIAFFFQMAMEQMESDLQSKSTAQRRSVLPFLF